MNLFIDTHLNDVTIILSNNNEILKQETVTNKQQNSTVVMPLIKKIIGKDKIQSIIVVNGPGSFTGVRLGVTVAKTLAYTLNIPIRTITSLECIALSIDEINKIVAFNDKNGYYIGIFDNENNLVGDYEYLSNSEYEEYSEKYDVITNVTFDYKNIIKFANQKKLINPHKVIPLYIKKLDVEK